MSEGRVEGNEGASSLDEVESRFQSYWEATQGGHCFTSSLRDRKAFLNPYLLEEVIATFGINDKGSCFPREQWDPLGLPAEGHYLHLDAAQQQYEEEKSKRVGLGLPGSIKFGAEVTLEPYPHVEGLAVEKDRGGVKGEDKAGAIVTHKRSRFSEK